MITKAEILAQAKELLATKGWHQGSFYSWETDEDDERVSNEPVAYCSLGAIMEATMEWAHANAYWFASRTLLNTEYEARDILAKAAGLNDRDEIPTWNDSPTRTKEEVLAAFDKAIEMSKT